MIDEQPPIEYISYNGLGRSPMLWGVPYMAGLMIMSASVLVGMLISMKFGGAGWLFALIGLPLIIFVRMICETDDAAVKILLLEVKWSLKKMLGGNAQFHGGTFAFAPVNYGRNEKQVARYFKAVDKEESLKK